MSTRSRRWPNRLMRPIRCSSREGFHGRSTLISVPRVWRFKPSQAASVATRRAAYRSFVFHVDEVDEALSALTSEGLRPGFEESTTIVHRVTRSMDVAEYRAVGVAR